MYTHNCSVRNLAYRHVGQDSVISTLYGEQPVKCIDVDRDECDRRIETN